MISLENFDGKMVQHQDEPIQQVRVQWNKGEATTRENVSTIHKQFQSSTLRTRLFQKQGLMIDRGIKIGIGIYIIERNLRITIVVAINGALTFVKSIYNLFPWGCGVRKDCSIVNRE